MSARAAVIVVVAACTPPAKPPATASDVAATRAETDADRRARLVAELEDDILQSYERDEPPDVETSLIDPRVGPARIGAGPGDVLYGDDVKLRASSRWPLFVGPATPTDVRSKRLDIHLSADDAVSAAWMSDQVAWRITLCGRTAAIQLRLTALYAHDGDRWVQVFEHLSFGRVPAPHFDDEGRPELYGLRMRDAVVDHALAEYPAGQLGRPLAALLSGKTAQIKTVVAFDPSRLAEDDPTRPAPSFLLAPDPDGEWHGEEDVARAQLALGPIQPIDRRVGVVGKVGKATVAYWVGNFVSDLPPRPGFAGGKVLLRGTFILEKRCSDGKRCDHPDQWIIAQGHVSEPIDDVELAQTVFGTALEMTRDEFLRKKPLKITCDEGRRATPVAAP